MTKTGLRDGATCVQRLKEEYKALIAYTGMNKSNNNDWFRIFCWYIHNLLKYEFDLQLDILVTYPSTASEIELPQGGKIYLTIHFKPLWNENYRIFGTAHALCLGLAPWLVAEVPILVDCGMSTKMM
uniref:Ubiquitin-fold modifier-conjugating enzyme 1 n=1 Tax=Nelumbo nucifera TaxID=4432 RepID=A0A822Y8Z7_NELNU|nr:TPA_asm: hypothetical protein HUJ06_030210 [Nelumbo nucifera]